jgi:tRNA splicing endonuclease
VPYETYQLLQYAIGTQAIEDMYLDEKGILLQIARQSGELSSHDLVEMLRSNNF